MSLTLRAVMGGVRWRCGLVGGEVGAGASSLTLRARMGGVRWRCGLVGGEVGAGASLADASG